ncbi:Uu.00g088470.m01.CDS01 [Anthostomella pinea]|uniref:Uu.00g088470.m01.CDS01 n=1 Tax=Anthostomella pinea TaxID=933095 RepID=A0AAI8VNG4_9PEZI|nr:Uu.00g088470.m01.CDS01 [Anthostomella pinea]
MALRHASSSGAHGRNASRERELPAGYTSISDVLNQCVPAGRLVSVIGLLKDHRLPIPTKATEYDAAGLVVSIFRPENAMPQPSAGDVVVVMSAKVQFYRSEASLLTNRTTIIHTYSASEIPRPPKSAKGALHPPCRLADRPPGDKEHEYVSWLYHSIDKGAVPEATTFMIQAENSKSTKDKFSKLENISDGRFCDVIVHVVKEPFDQMDKTTLWISDYTENDSFFKFSVDGTNQSEGRDGDPYGYINTAIPAASNWRGPFGKRSMQVTCFEPHASFVNTGVKAGDWIRLRNLQIKFGRNNANLEGYLREDRSAFGGQQIQVDVLETDDPQHCDSRLKEAVKRKYEYEKLKKKQLKSLAGATAGQNGDGGNKRKADDAEEQKNSSKSRRQAKREAARKRAEDDDKRAQERLGLNELGKEKTASLSMRYRSLTLLSVKCESLDQPVTPVSSIIDPAPWKTTIEGQEVTLMLPFTNVKYRANVRVVDFRPRKLELFASWRKNTEYDMLSDYSGGDSDSDSDDDEGQGNLDLYRGQKTWEWRFALQLEEVDPKQKGEPDRFWAVVDNTEAQQLTCLDATDLRANPDDLVRLHEQLFKLWGDLEELKRQEQQRQLKNQKRVAAHQPPPDSSPPEDPEGNGNNMGNGVGNNTSKTTKASNKPFTCCIQQYGVKVREPDPRKADAGEGRRWVRVYGLFGTTISS